MTRICVPLADGFEEIEAVTLIDVLRRADFSVSVCSASESFHVKGAHSIIIGADISVNEALDRRWEGIVLPGGMPGAEHLRDTPAVETLLKQIFEADGLVGAVCAAPLVLGHYGLLKGRKATCYPGFEDRLTGATAVEEPVVVDGNVITSRGPGTVMAFALKIVEYHSGKEKAAELEETMLFQG